MQTLPDYPLLTDALDATVRRFADRPAMEFFGRVWTYAQFGQLVARATRGLQDLGVGPGDRVGLCLPNTPYFMVLYYAVLKAGAAVVNFNPLYTPRELAHQIGDSGVEVMAVPDLPDIQHKIAALADSCALKSIVVCPMAEVMPPIQGLLYRMTQRRAIARLPRDGRHRRFSGLIDHSRAPTPRPIGWETLAVLQYTGGTTGTPKGVMLSHRNIAANAAQVLGLMDDTHAGDERVVAVLPLFHVFAMTAVMNVGVVNGSEILLLPRFDIQALLKLIARRKVTVLHAVPTIYGAINAAAAKTGVDLSSIRLCISGGAPLPADIADTFRKLTGAVLSEGYGLSETSPVLTCSPLDGHGKPGSVGPAVAGTVIEIRDVADPHRILGVGERGEVCARGPQVMSAYWRKPEETAAVFVDGTLRTGDVGYLDEDGCLFLVDRIKDVIISSGFKIYPRVLEEALYRHPAVSEAVVLGVPDSYRGQAPKAFVTLVPGQTVTIDELRDYLATQVSKIEMPRDIEIRANLPKTAIGKPSKNDLREQGVNTQPDVAL